MSKESAEQTFTKWQIEDPDQFPGVLSDYIKVDENTGEIRCPFDITGMQDVLAVEDGGVETFEVPPNITGKHTLLVVTRKCPRGDT